MSGIDVNKRRRQAIYLCGLCAGLGGAFLTLGPDRQLRAASGVAGRGFIAIAAVIFGGWTLKGTIAGASSSALHRPSARCSRRSATGPTPQLLTSLPYVLALATMLLFAHRTRPPAALARPFVRGLT